MIKNWGKILDIQKYRHRQISSNKRFVVDNFQDNIFLDQTGIRA
ncbi:MAG: hypothetical protein O4859_31610 [Trichodesmium sp. St18_bin1]|nr:hypothetical protein [Trichodesmium sp. St18_bin1]